MKANRIALSAALLATTSLVPVSAAWAQDAEQGAQEPSDVITVRYQYVPEEKRVTSEVSSVVDAGDIQITGDSDIASALGRVTGLSISEGRFVVVRGLNERYSNTLINGSPLASPEPFRRAVPLDLFPTSLISNILVQKTYSPQFPGEFGGGVVEIDTAALPEEGFVEIGLSSAIDSSTTFQDGLTYDGGEHDWLGYDDGTRQWPEGFKNLFETSEVGPSEQDPTTLAELGRAFENSGLWLVQRDDLTPADAGVDLTLGDRYDFDGFSIGVLAAVGYDNSWSTQVGRRGKARVTGDQLSLSRDFHRMGTTNTIESNGLLNVGLETGDHSVQALALVLRSTEKETNRLLGFDSDLDALVRNDRTAWYERQVYTYQVSGEHTFDVGEGLGIDWRWSTADASRWAPNQREAFYEWDGPATEREAVGETYGLLEFEPFNDDFLLRNSGDGNRISFSRVDETTDEYGADVTLPVMLFGIDWEWMAGFAHLERERKAYNREFRFTGTIPADLRGSRIDYIFADQNILDTRFRLQETGGVLTPEAYRGNLEVESYYVSTDAQLTPFLRAALGARFEDGEQTLDTFGFPAENPADVGDNEGFISEDYVLPAATITWTFAENMQLRVGYSETIIRPQFRELGFTLFFDPDVDELFRGNPFLVNSELQNYDARFEWYFGRDQFFTAGVFYKTIENPIVEYILPDGENLSTSFVNAPEATLTGFELEFEKRFDFSDRFEGEFWQNAEFFVKSNYTYIDSEMSAGANDTVIVAEPGAGADPQASVGPAAGFINDGEPLQGQSEHLANLQVGWEDNAANTRTALLVNYTGERSRALANVAVGLPAVIEEPPLLVDLVHSRSIDLEDGNTFDVRFAVRNILGEDYVATQSAAGSSIVVDSYEVGTTFSINLSRTF
ncbi:TonB-dependent receptor [Marinicauda algicola]|uniref:TonB-dependent receptor n=1 Tax=Marinicauda algicola TaxID=2029849 RepID=A0A4S2H4D6_9PROT|nr:TonB-dependent receptor [Marinicauda algicola]TGY90393.1 TonB-dependent receptor [Marinicauda algicola]